MPRTPEQLLERLQTDAETTQIQLGLMLDLRRSKAISKVKYASEKKKLSAKKEKLLDRIYDTEKEIKDLKKRTYVLSQEYTREKLAFTLRGQFGGDYRVVPEATSTHTRSGLNWAGTVRMCGKWNLVSG